MPGVTWQGDMEARIPSVNKMVKLSTKFCINFLGAHSWDYPKINRQNRKQ